MSLCEWCRELFEPKMSFQVYCSPDCRTEASKEKSKIRNRSQAFRRRAKSKRYCVNECGTLLSIYNPSRICASCATDNKKVSKVLDDIRNYFDVEDLT